MRESGFEAVVTLVVIAAIGLVTLWIFDWDMRCLVVDCVITKP